MRWNCSIGVPALVLSCIALQSYAAVPSISKLKETFGDQLRVAGPLDGLDVKHSVIYVAGQAVVFCARTAVNDVSALSKLNVIPASIGNLQLGDYIAVTGGVDSEATSINRMRDGYVAGADEILVRGNIEELESSLGIGRIGNLTVDFTASIAGSAQDELARGVEVEVHGIQPVFKGALLAKSVTGNSVAHSIVGTSKSIVGTSTPHSIVGTSSTQSIVGTSAPRSIVGTSTSKSIVGTSAARSIVGTSLNKSIVGTSSTQSIVGTSAPRSIVGTSTSKSIVGTSASRSIVGTSLNKSIVGTSSTQSIVGTSAPRSIVGTSLTR